MINEDQLISLIETSLELDSGTIRSEDEEWQTSWDSLGHLSILVKLDQFLDGKCSNLSNLAQATSVAEIKKVLKENDLFED